MSSTFSRMFATPTEKDVERLFQLPADILTKLATDARYIDPEPEYVSKGNNNPKKESSASSGGFSGFSFNVEDSSKSKKENTTTPPVVLANVLKDNSTEGVQKPYYLYRDGPDGK